MNKQRHTQQKAPQVLPHDDTVEKMVLSTLLSEPNALSEVREVLKPEVFYENFHQHIYRAILAVDSRGDIPDLFVVRDELKKTLAEDYKEYDFMEIVRHSSRHLYRHACLLQEKAQRRRFHEIGNYLVSQCFSETTDVIDILSNSRKMLDGMYETTSTTISDVKLAIEGVYNRIYQNRMNEGSLLTGASTGFREFDRQSGGFQKGDLVVIAGETSMGKTSLAVSMAMNSGQRVAFYSMEMKKEQIAARMIAIESGIPANEILFKKLSDGQLNTVDKGVSQVLDKPLFFDDRSTSSIDMIIASIRMMKIKHNIQGAVVDYLQILNVNMKGVTKEQQMGEAARRLKNLAMEQDIWIIALSQLNRDTIRPVPTLNRLRDSGQIAEAADIVMLIYRPELHGRSYPEPFQRVATQGTAMIDVAKGRNIGLLKFICGFEKETTRFYEDEKVAAGHSAYHAGWEF